MKLILLTVLLIMIAVVSVVVARRRREQARAERAKALRAEREKRKRERIPNVSANLRGPTGLSLLHRILTAADLFTAWIGAKVLVLWSTTPGSATASGALS